MANRTPLPLDHAYIFDTLGSARGVLDVLGKDSYHISAPNRWEERGLSLDAAIRLIAKVVHGEAPQLDLKKMLKEPTHERFTVYGRKPDPHPEQIEVERFLKEDVGTDLP